MSILNLILSTNGGLRAQRLPVGMSWEDRIWHTRFIELLRWREANPGSWPRKSVGPQEKRMSEWLGNQRQAQKNGNPLWSEVRESALDTHFPGWDKTHSFRWEETLGELILWQSSHDKFPGHTSADPVERRLARWLGKQKEMLAGSRPGWTTERGKTLDRRLPGWRNPNATLWERRLNEVILWAETNERLPRSHGQGVEPTEAKLGRWLSKQREASKSQHSWWSVTRREQLDAGLHSWEKGNRPGPKRKQHTTG